MAMHPYLEELRTLVGPRPLLLPSVSILVGDRDRYLFGFLNHAQRWACPGGAIDPGESPADAALRETWEETGLFVELIRLVGCFSGSEAHRVVYPNGHIVDYVNIVFEARIVSGTPTPDGTEFSMLEWLRLDEVLERPVSPWIPVVLGSFEAAAHGYFESSWMPPGSST
jgi:8-oxo-dGTP pyrophosphatase MutT (NUDIX family)